jgi:spore germination protein KA
MGLTFEILQEAGIRMPRPIGQAISIVGALVIGEASVRAGLVSDPMVIVTAITAISTFILPPLQRMLPYFRLIFIILANILGLLGMVLGLIAIITHMCALRSFGVPYLTPFAPSSPLDMKDTLFRFPHWLMFTRPRALTWQETGRAKYRIDLASSIKNKTNLENRKKMKNDLAKNREG